MAIEKRGRLLELLFEGEDHERANRAELDAALARLDRAKRRSVDEKAATLGVEARDTVSVKAKTQDG